jgi:hemolysin activation/secretion protein
MASCCLKVALPLATGVTLAAYAAVPAHAASFFEVSSEVDQASSDGGAADASASNADASSQSGQAQTDTKQADDKQADKKAAGDGKGQDKDKDKDKAAAAAQPKGPVQHFDIDDFAVQGADSLPQIQIEEAIYPFLGPNKTADDVEKARAALEKAYHDKGLQTVSVAVPQQNPQNKVIVLKVTELKVGRLRVKNSRYFDIDRIKEGAKSLKEGTVPNFNNVTKDIVALNQWPDRRVTPALRAGVTPGTVDVDLNVDDTAPVHGSFEINNRQSPDTTASRIAATVHYDDLWQRGDSASFSYQVAPENPKDAQVFSGSYLARLDDIDWLSVLFYGVDSNSNVATVGGTNIVGPGQIVGSRAVITLPSLDNLYHTLSVGIDYKHFDQTVSLGSDSFASPVTYYPLVANYSATFKAEKSTTQLSASLTYNMRPVSSPADEFDAKRFNASPSFTHFNIDLQHTQELPEGLQFYGRVQTQVADGPLVSSEQMSVGGMDTVRGYLESETLGDNGVAGTLELRGPDIGTMLQSKMKDETGLGNPRFTTFDEWRFFGFVDAGMARTLQPLIDQQAEADLWSYGVGTKFKVFKNVNGVVDLAMPMISQAYTQARDPRVSFRIWGEF